MVTLSKLYTRTGDGGMTRLGDMSQVPKTSTRIAAYGCVDELNSAIGLARASGAEHDNVLARVQNDLFDLGADLCVPQADGADEHLRVKPQQVLFPRATDRPPHARLGSLAELYLAWGKALRRLASLGAYGV